MKYSKCVASIQANSSKPLLLQAIESLKLLEERIKNKEKLKNIRNWRKIGEARLTPNKLSSIRLLDESKLAGALFDNPSTIEGGLKMICREFDLRIGKADLLAQDKNKNWVLIELKGGQAIGQAIGQLLSYLFAFRFYFKKEARGIIIAPKFHPQCLGAYEFLKNAGINQIELQYFNGKKTSFIPEKFNLTKHRKITKEQWEIWKMIKG